MARKETPKPLFVLKHDFQLALDNVSQQGIMLIQAAEMFLRRHEGLPGADVLQERVVAFRSALSSDE